MAGHFYQTRKLDKYVPTVLHFEGPFSKKKQLWAKDAPHQPVKGEKSDMIRQDFGSENGFPDEKCKLARAFQSVGVRAINCWQ